MGSGVRHFGSRGVSADLQRRPWRLARRQKAKNSKAGLVPGGSSIKVNQEPSIIPGNNPWGLLMGRPRICPGVRPWVRHGSPEASDGALEH